MLPFQKKNSGIKDGRSENMLDKNESRASSRAFSGSKPEIGAGSIGILLAFCIYFVTSYSDWKKLTESTN